MIDTPPKLMRLWSCSDADARHFRANIRFFNCHFSFTSLYCHLDHISTNMRNGLEPRHPELYFYNDDPSLQHRYDRCRKDCLKQHREVISMLARILRGNPYSEHLRSMGHAEDIKDYHIALNLDQRLDQRT